MSAEWDLPPEVQSSQLMDLSALKGAANLASGCDRTMLSEDITATRFNAELAEARKLIRQIATSPDGKANRRTVLKALRRDLTSALLVEQIDASLRDIESERKRPFD